jgi:hypothetical protein
VALAVAGLLGLILLLLWLARVPIATRFVDQELARRGVPATYTLAGLGTGGQRLTNVVLGDPADPDLVADWIETRTGVGRDGPYLIGVRAGRVRVRARLVNGRVSLGAVDRLLPPPSGKPFALPSIELDVADARVRLKTPAGVVGLKLAGRGRLNDGFAGTLAAVAPRVEAGACRVDGMSAVMRVRIVRAAPSLNGPVQAGAVVCGAGGARVLRADLAATLTPALDRWNGSARLATQAAAGGGATMASMAGRVSFAGSGAGTQGRADVTGQRVAARGFAGRSLRLVGDYRVGGGETRFAGVAQGRGIAAPGRLTAQVTGAISGAAGTPVGPLAEALGRAVAAAGRSFDATADLAVAAQGGRGRVSVARLAMRAASGAWVGLEQAAVTYDWPANAVRVAGRLEVEGGGLPSARVRLAQAHAGAAITGVATLRVPYVAGGASLALSPVRFTAGGDGATRIDTLATLSGPIGDGRVDGLVLPVAARLDGRGAVTLGTACAPVAWQRLAVAGLTLEATRLTLCPTKGALVRVAGGRIGGGARIGAASVGGRLGATPVTLAWTGARVDLGARRFALSDVRSRLGSADRATRLDFAGFDGRVVGAGVAGRFGGGSGQIGAVPLLLSNAAGGWRFAGGVLAVDGAMQVADAAASARFQPLAARSVSLTLARGVIEAKGELVEPTRGVKVADVDIRHLLETGTGRADLSVPGIRFAEGFQPELLTRVTFGVIADVRGTVAGTGRIDWGPGGVTSTGRFRTDGTDLAAAFGPVTGITGEIVFDDLLSLRSAPDQVARVATINPGIAVTDGVIRYRTRSSTEVEVAGGRWPFAGGTLTLAPTLLDFGQDRPKRLTFLVEGMAADRFLQQFDFDNLNATGVFDGVLPMIFDASGGRIEDGRLTVRAGGGGIAYVGELTQKDLGVWGNLAFQALRSIRYRTLNITMNGPLAGEMVTEVRFAGVSQGEGAKTNFLVRRLQRLPFVFNIRIRAPFRGLLDSAQSFYDPKRLIQRNLPALMERRPPVQPPASETRP